MTDFQRVRDEAGRVRVVSDRWLTRWPNDFEASPPVGEEPITDAPTGESEGELYG